MKTIRLTYNRITSVIVLLCMVVIISCTRDNEIPDIPVGPNGEIPVLLTIHSSLKYNETITKSQTDIETKIDEIQVLVFEDGIYKYTAQGTIQSSSISSTTFSAVLKSSTKSVKLYIMANVTSDINNSTINPGNTEDEVKRKITKSFSTAGINSSFPMFGEYSLPSGLDATIKNVFTNIKMLRAVARVDVLRNTDVNNFTLTSIQAFRANDRMQVIPNTYNTEDMSITEPSIPNVSSRAVHTSSITVSGNLSTSQLYLPETLGDSDESIITCVVIGGLYDTDQTPTYYRIDFNSGLTDHPLGQILRNHRYIFNIKSVAERGKSTAVEAANSGASGIEVEVTNWDENLTYMVFDGSKYFSISSRNVDLSYKINDSVLLDVSTDVDTYALQWSNAAGELSSPETNLTAIVNENFKAGFITVDGKIKLRIKNLKTNDTGTEKKQYFTIIARNWRIVIEITQHIKPDFSGEYIKILSISTTYGSLGGASITSALTNTGTSGIQQLIRNSSNFSPNGTVKIAGFQFNYFISDTYINNYASSPSGSFTNLALPALLETYDIIIVPYNENPNSTVSKIIAAWLKKPHRVLFIAHDTPTVGANLLTELGTLGIWATASGSNSSIPVASSPDNDYFYTSGPFGPVPSTTAFTGDATWYGILKEQGDLHKLTALLSMTKNSQEYYTLAIDKNKRVVYCGESEYYISGNLGTNGLVDNDKKRLMANIYAWAIEDVILPGRVK